MTLIMQNLAKGKLLRILCALCALQAQAQAVQVHWWHRDFQSAK
jgi:hypothetical protein